MIKKTIFFIFMNLSPLLAKVPYERIEKLINSGKLDQAEQLIYQSQAEGDFSIDLQLLMTKVYLARKDIKNAYQVIISIEKPEDYKTINKLTNMLIEVGDTALSLRYREMAINLFYKAYEINDQIYLGLRARLVAQRLMEEMEYENAKQLFDKYFSEGGNFEDVAPEYIRCLYMLGEWSEIIKKRNIIVNLRTDAELQYILGDAYMSLARAYLDQENFENAIEMLDKLIEWGIPKTYIDDAYYLKGQALEILGEYNQALECYYKVLTLAPPRSIYARKARERINALEKK